FWKRKPVFPLQPVINDDEAQNIYPNSTFSLVCGVIIEVGDVIRIDWNYPTSALDRVSESKLISSPIDDINLFSSKRISVREALPTDAGIYKCCVSDWLQQKHCSNKTITINDKQLPLYINFTSDLPSQAPVIQNIGEEFIFVVTFEAYPNINGVKMYWLKDGDKFSNAHTDVASDTPVTRIHSKVDGNQVILTIKSVVMQDTGVYTLVALSTDKVAEISRRLLVRGEPYVSVKNRSSFYLENNEYYIFCEIISYPKPTIQWFWFPCFNTVNDCNVNNETQWIDLSNNTSSINNETVMFYNRNENEGLYRVDVNVTAHKSGIYRCLAKNDNGTKFKNEYFIVSDINEKGYSLNASAKEAVEKEYFTLTCK
ncbi:Vascular endothelial growth factor receptor 3-like protein, partial [Leptotrombidium deliense]